MLSLLYDDFNDLDYTELTQSYMGFFSLAKLQNFLNTTQNGAAHSSSGIDLSVLLRNIATSLGFCIIQLTCFCFFRSMFKSLYQPRCWYVPISQRMEPLPEGLLKWILPSIKCSINFYISMGLDAYFFIRFLSILLLFFCSIGILNIVVLIPINWTGNDDHHSAVGLDKLSLSNISVLKVNRLKAHFVMSLITIICFHWLLIYELRSFVKIRQAYLLSKRQKNSVIHRTLLISNVPDYLMDPVILERVLLAIPGGAKRIWYVSDFLAINQEVQRAKEALNYLEESEVKYLSNYLKKKHPILKTDEMVKSPDTSNDALVRPLFYPPIYLPPISLPRVKRTFYFRLPGFLRLFKLESRVSIQTWSMEKLREQSLRIDELKLLQSDEGIKKLDKVFVEFESQTSAYIAHQCLLSQVQGNLNSTLVEVHPHDILWNNLIRSNSTVATFEKYSVTMISIFIIILYVVPVSFIGLISQLPLLTQLIPSMKWIYKLPEEIRDSVSSFLPAILLSLLTDILLMTFRFLTYYKGKLTGAQLELDLQKWYFVFLFVQQFLVVTILTSVTVLFRQVIEQPASVPILLAANLPKAATFFFQYITLKAFAFCGNNFLRIDQLVMHLTWNKIRYITPRQKFYKLTSLPNVKWGNIYPVYSVYASIGLAYSLISPLISVFLIFILSLVLLYYKYALKYIFNHINVSETYGRLYPVALLNLYTGIYCLECCFIGIFFSLKNLDGECPMKVEGFMMSLVLLLTIFGNINIYNKYVEHFLYLPILSDKKFLLGQSPQDGHSSTMNSNHTSGSNTYYLNKAMIYSHPATKYEKPKIWLPRDCEGESEREITRVLRSNTGIEGGSSKGATISLNTKYRWINIEVTEAPPDFK